jgi:hypothetical protein
MIADAMFRPISGIKECVEKAKIWDALIIMVIVIAANLIPWRGNKVVSIYVIEIGTTLYIIFYGTLLTAGGMYLGKKMNFKNNYSFPYVSLPFSFLSIAYIGLISLHKEYFFILFILLWEGFLEILYVKYSFKEIGIMDSILIVVYSCLMRIFVIGVFLISNKFYWLR